MKAGTEALYRDVPSGTFVLVNKQVGNSYELGLGHTNNSPEQPMISCIFVRRLVTGGNPHRVGNSLSAVHKYSQLLLLQIPTQHPNMDPKNSSGHWDPALLRFVLPNNPLFKDSAMERHGILEARGVTKESHHSSVDTFADSKQLYPEFINYP